VTKTSPAHQRAIAPDEFSFVCYVHCIHYVLAGWLSTMLSNKKGSPFGEPFYYQYFPKIAINYKPMSGFEPLTCCLRNSCSTTEPHRRTRKSERQSVSRDPKCVNVKMRSGATMSAGRQYNKDAPLRGRA